MCSVVPLGGQDHGQEPLAQMVSTAGLPFICKMLILTFTNRKLIFCCKKITLFLFPPHHKQNFKENIFGIKLFPAGFQFRW